MTWTWGRDEAGTAGPGPRACPRCGLDLHGLSAFRYCPRCGAPVAFDQPADPLWTADLAWRDALRRGMRLVQVGLAGVLVAGFLVGAATVAHSRPLHLVAWLFALGFTVAESAGLWLLTTPEPGPAGARQEDGRLATLRTLRTLVRAGAVCNVLLQLLGLPDAAQTASQPAQAGLMLMSTPLMAVLAVAWFALLAYVARLARRTGDGRLERRANFLFWAMGLTTALLYLGVVVAALALAVSPPAAHAAGATAAPPSPLAAMGAIGGCLGGCGLLVALVTFDVMFVLLLQRLIRAAEPATAG